MPEDNEYGFDWMDEEAVEEPATEDPVEVELQSFIQRAVEEAINWREEELDEQQEKATNYYMGRPYGNEVEGRSRVVSTDVRDTVQAILPSLARIFFGPEDVVEYEAMSPDGDPGARQATIAANEIIRKDNEGFLQVHGVMKDAMVRKIGIMKVWHEDSAKVTGESYTGLTEEALVALEADEGVEEVEVVGQYGMPALHSPTGMVTLYDADITRVDDDSRIRFACIPPEEFIFSPDARDKESAEILGHVRHVPASELVAMGIDKDLVDKHKGRTSHTNTGDNLSDARRFDQDDRAELGDERDPARDEVMFGEIYAWADVSEDRNGTASLVEVRVIGEAFEMVDFRHVEERPFALWVCDPEPHTLVPLSIADLVMDIQLINSNIWRGILDSLTLTLNPRTEIVEGEVNMGDAMNHEIGGLVRVEKPGMMREVAHSFVGKEALPVLDYMTGIKENRTGISKAAAGLDADALQSATKTAVAATLSGAQQHIEMLARVFAETGFKQFYTLLLKFMVRHQQRPRMIRHKNEWVEVDPRAWDADMGVRINVALGGGTADEKLQILAGIAEKQDQLKQQGSPLVTDVEIRNTLGAIIELSGMPDSNKFFRPWGPEEEQQAQQQKAQQPPQDPALMVAQAEIQIEQQRLALEQQEAVWKNDRENAKIQMDFALKQATAELQYDAQISNQEVQRDVSAAKAIIDADAKARQMKAAAQAAGGQNGPSGGGQGGGQPPQ